MISQFTTWRSPSALPSRGPHGLPNLSETLLRLNHERIVGCQRKREFHLLSHLCAFKDRPRPGEDGGFVFGFAAGVGFLVTARTCLCRVGVCRSALPVLRQRAGFMDSSKLFKPHRNGFWDITRAA